VIAISEGFSSALLSNIFLLDAVRRYFCLYQEGGINGLLEIRYEVRHSFLTEYSEREFETTSPRTYLS
jgi:hypothetical protein